MRCLLDMGLSPATADFLRARGHDAVHLREQNLQRALDQDILIKARDEQRVLVTFDLDFARLLALLRVAAPSVILFRLEQFTTNQINDLLLRTFEDQAEELKRGAIVIIEPNRIRLRQLPIW